MRLALDLFMVLTMRLVIGVAQIRVLGVNRLWMRHFMFGGNGRNRKKHHKKSSENKLFHGPNVAREPRLR